MKKRLFLCGAMVTLMVTLMLTGCSNKSDSVAQNSSDYSNMDISGIDSEISIEQTLYKMDVDLGNWDSTKIEDEFVALVKYYGNREKNIIDPKTDVTCDFMDETTGDLNFVNYADVKNISDIRYTHFYADDFYLDMTAAGMFEMYHPDTVYRVTGETQDIKYSWRPNFEGTPVKTYELPQDDIADVSYTLNGQDVSLTDAVDFMENQYLKNGSLPNIAVPGMDFQVKEISVYQYGTNYGYYFVLEQNYEGVRVDTEDAILDTSAFAQDEVVPDYVGNSIKVFMLADESVDYIWNSAFNRAPENKTEVTPEITYQKALELLSDHLSQDYVFTVMDAYLTYNFYTDYSEQDGYGMSHVKPVWQFEISNDGMQQYNKIIIDIDVETGEIVERYE